MPKGHACGNVPYAFVGTEHGAGLFQCTKCGGIVTIYDTKKHRIITADKGESE